jgi:hypothetical protein
VKVVYLNPIGAVGGGERALLAMMVAVRRQDPRVKVHLNAGTGGPLLDRAAELGAATTLLEMPAVLGDSAQTPGGRLARIGDWLRRAVVGVPALRCYVADLHARLRDLDADVIHSNGLKMHLLGSLARPPGVPLLWHVHDFYGLRPVPPPLLRPLCGRVARALAVSEAVAGDTRQVLPGLC